MTNTIIMTILLIPFYSDTFIFETSSLVGQFDHHVGNLRMVIMIVLPRNESSFGTVIIYSTNINTHLLPVSTVWGTVPHVVRNIRIKHFSSPQWMYTYSFIIVLIAFIKVSPLLKDTNILCCTHTLSWNPKDGNIFCWASPMSRVHWIGLLYPIQSTTLRYLKHLRTWLMYIL